MSFVERILQAAAPDSVPEQIYYAIKWGYDPARAVEFDGHRECCTPKQSAYITRLSKGQETLARELEYIINLERKGAWNALCACSKGQAMFVIPILLGNRQPIAETLHERIIETRTIIELAEKELAVIQDALDNAKSKITD